MTAWEVLRETPRRLGSTASQARPELRSIVSPPRRIAPVPFGVMMVALLVAGMVGLLLLNTQLQNQAFEVRDAQRTASELGYRVSDLEAQVTRAAAPATLGRRASEMGMVPNPHAVFIDLESGRVVGEPRKVTGQEVPSLVLVPPAPEVPPLDPEAPAVDPSNPDAGAAAAPPDPAAGTPVDPASATTKPQPSASASASAKPSASAAAKPAASAKPSASAAANPTASAKPTASAAAKPSASSTSGANT